MSEETPAAWPLFPAKKEEEEGDEEEEKQSLRALLTPEKAARPQ